MRKTGPRGPLAVNDEQRNRAILHDLEEDWRGALETMQEVQIEEFREYRDKLAAIHGGYRRLAIWQVLNSLLLIVVVVGGLILLGNQSDSAKMEALRNGKALCALRGDVEARVRQGTAFLGSHPDGLPGFPAGAIRVSVANSARTVRVLSGLQCPTP